MVEATEKSRKRWTHGWKCGEIKKTVNLWAGRSQQNVEIKVETTENQESGELMVETTEKSEEIGELVGETTEWCWENVELKVETTEKTRICWTHGWNQGENQQNGELMG